MRKTALTLSPLLFGTLQAGCMMGPDYERPKAIISASYKEAPPPAGWKYANPQLAELPKGEWWRLYNDPLLNKMEEEIDISNQNLKEAEASYRQARAIIDETRAGLFPTLTLTPRFNRQGNGGSARSISTGGGIIDYSTGQVANTYSLGTTANWDLDVWGKIRRNIESQTAAAQASAADLANARLSYQAQLAIAYFNLRYQDSLKTLLERNLEFFKQSLRVTKNQYEAGTIDPTAYYQALTQLHQTEAQIVQTGINRAQYEHAIAVLMGHPPEALKIAPGRLTDYIPEAPVTIPATLLQRRPDIAAAERRMQQQNAQIGVAIAAFFPDISLSAALSYNGDPLGSLIQVSNRIWSLGAAASQTVFDGGQRSATVRAAEAQYDQAVATYRQTVLTALQNTEDQLSNLRILGQQAKVQYQTVHTSEEAARIAFNQYLAGTQDYTTVVSAQLTSLNNQQTALGIQQQRVIASVNLIQQLGGGWTTKRLPEDESLNSDLPFVPKFIDRNHN
ncbi:efflux transporter outer membrane subunit [Entomobacter blattae]|nr:efflux transporter outer membrane subunit [Entomobacter blattae]